MNIIGAIYRGRIISMPKGPDIRPTSNKAREALFNILKGRVMDSRVLDLFAGSASLGLEAMSRGAREAVFVDNNPKCINVIKKNLKGLQLAEKSKVMKLNTDLAIKKLSREEKFDLIFMDPPYFKDLIKKTLINLDQYDILNHSGLIICEHHKKEGLPEEIASFKRLKISQYGDTALSIYKRK